MPIPKRESEVLDQLRVVERALTIPDLDPEAVAALRLAADRLMAEYQGYVTHEASENFPEPPPFPAG